MNTVGLLLAAGHGTRLRSSVPKVFHDVAGKSLLRRAAEPLRASVDRLIVVAGPDLAPYEAALEGLDVEFAIQESPRGTGDAVASAIDLLRGISGTLLIACGDVPNLRSATYGALLQAHRDRSPAPLVTVAGMEVEDPTGYGRIVVSPEAAPLRIVEHADAGRDELSLRLVNTGIYAIEFPALWDLLQQLSDDNAQGEVYFTDVVQVAAERNNRYTGLYVLPDPTECQGVNSRAELAAAKRTVWNRNVQRLQEEGVTIMDPATTYIEDEVTAGPDVILHPGVILQGRTSLGDGCEVGAWTRLRDCTIDPEATVLDHCHLQQAHIQAGAAVGPFSRMRGGVTLGEGSQVGNFVEVKGSTIGAGTKAKHLAYLGNATIGRDANIGAGTITCNHDGERKHPTVLEDEAYVGSNSTLVAPVTIGTRAYVGAGSVITEDVPPDDLALGRCRQTNKTNWAASRRAKSPKVPRNDSETND